LSSFKPIGIRLERKKDASLLNWNLKRPYPPEKIFVPIPLAASPCVRTGDKVEIGQKIATPQSPEGVSVHASISGTVERVAAFPDSFGKKSLMIEIHRPRESKPHPAWELRKDWEQVRAEKIPEILRDSGLMTTDPRLDPVHVKLASHAGTKTVLINLCDPEPYITCEQVLAMSHPVEILRGAELLRKACAAEKILVAIESCNQEMAELIKSKIYFLKWTHVEVRTVPALYPQGLENALLQAWFPGDEGRAVTFSTSTAFAVYEAIALQKPFFERVVTVGGECVVEPRSLWLPLGISFRDAIHACKGVMREPSKVLMGGPMAGEVQANLEVPVTAATGAILALPREIVKDEIREPCIRCNRCVDHCPVLLSPAMITLAVETGEFAVAREWNASDCIECGVCAYVCPAKRPMLELIRRVNIPEGWAVLRG
jgi:electron transport complex protein RnfC